MTWNDIPIAIENPKGSIRTGVGRDGKRWFCELPAAYGEIRKTEGQDGDPVDVYVGPAHGSKRVWVIDQVDADTGRSDEHKCLLAFPNKDAALKAYEASFSDGKAKQRVGAVTELSVAEFRDWLKHGDTTKPMSQQKKPDKALEVAQRYTKGYAYGGRVGYAEGGPAGEIASEMTRDLRRDRQRRALAGRELTPDEEAAYIDYVARLPERREMKSRELDGITSGIGEMLTPGETLPMMDARTRRQIAARSLAGRDLTYDQMRDLADQEAINEERSARLGVPLGIAATELTGVPSMVRGGGNGGTGAGQNGGSGGGGPGESGLTAGTGTVGQGNNGGTGNASAPRRAGGGGGASAVGASGSASGNGGAGTSSSISGSAVTYGGGGGGSCESTTPGTGGAGGGGAGGNAAAGTAGTANTGGGGGGGGRGSGTTGTFAGGNGGSGIVIISYPGPQRGTGGTVTSSGGNTIHTFTTSGTYTA